MDSSAWGVSSGASFAAFLAGAFLAAFLAGAFLAAFLATGLSAGVGESAVGSLGAGLLTFALGSRPLSLACSFLRLR